jgi:uncharacterized protein YjbI with pentapeptide repeats
MKRSCALVVVLWTMLGCGDGDGAEPAPPAIERMGFGEADLLDPTARPGLQHSRVFQLEATGTHAGDTAEEGVDRGPLFVDEATRHLFCFEDPEGQAHRMRILDASGAILLDLPANDCANVDLPAGRYEQEFEHGRRGQNGALPAVILTRPVLGGDATRAALQEAGRLRSAVTASPSCNATDCTATQVAYSAMNLTAGQVALFPSTCPPQPADLVWVFKGNCADTGIAQVHGMHVGPWTQTVVYEGTNWAGSMHGLSSRVAKEACFPYDQPAVAGRHASLRVIPYPDPVPSNPCEVVSGGYYCSGCQTTGPTTLPANAQQPVNTTSSFTPPATGQVLVVGSGPAGTCCQGALVLQGGCPDLGLYGFDDTITRIALGPSTEVDLFGDVAFGGTKSSWSDSGSNPYTLLDHDGFHTAKNEASSLIVDTWTGIVAATLVSTRRCTGCNLQGANLAGLDSGGTLVELSGANLAGATLTGAQIPGANLASALLQGANLSMANLKGANLGSAKLGELRDATGKITIAAATLDGAWMEDVILSGPADLTAVSAKGVYFYAGDAAAATVAGSTLLRIDFTGAVLKGLNLHGATIAGASFYQADLTKAILTAAIATDATQGHVDFRQASMQGADMTGTDFDRADFTGALLNATKVSTLVRTVQGVGKDAAGNLAYVPQYQAFTCDAQIPNMLPQSTTSATTCPDGAPGPCTGNGGESGPACPGDCGGIGSQCATPRHCVAVDWPSGIGPGHWACSKGVCTASGSTSTCGNGTCDAAGGETPASCPADCALDCQLPSHCWALPWVGTAPGNWMCGKTTGLCAASAQSLFCGDKICMDAVGESPASCPADCGTAAACSGTANRCANLAWPHADCQGSWSCSSGACLATCDTVHCGDGTCNWTAGESPRSCPRDCVMGGCTERAHCAGRPWPTGVFPGHWECVNRICSTITEDNTCGDTLCDRNGRWVLP